MHLLLWLWVKFLRWAGGPAVEEKPTPELGDVISLRRYRREQAVVGYRNRPYRAGGRRG